MNKMLIAATASSILLLAGCASGPDGVEMTKMDQLSNQVSQLSDQISALKSEQSTLSSKVSQAADAATAAQEEAARANERIDNIAQSYTK
ncbi:hypothetical protein CCZ37_18250 [Vibrio qinghaiensis]|jgi:murein lipoprotein|uniref:Major outer membrane lipoprotein Lpp n=1 Tax=Vibrio qinghaiensis TaxID=2025808 RepID=A0A223N3Y5_9VIBR|nr:MULTISPECIES: Lpp/OprI family alanine-zipper lipoprotein [Vibrio]ASU24383.1 hypothetical protein CCZ37_18250 [Vibrio qinghaiensis]